MDFAHGYDYHYIQFLGDLFQGVEWRFKIYLQDRGCRYCGHFNIGYYCRYRKLV